MNKVISTWLLLVVATVGHTQVTDDTYCIKLRRANADNYFAYVPTDSIPAEWRSSYEVHFSDWSKALSMFNEEPIAHSNHEVFRLVTFGAFNNPHDVQILRIEKRDNKVEITIKLLQKLKDSTVLVHKKLLNNNDWVQFTELAARHFISQPTYQPVKAAVFDGVSTVYEGQLGGKYHFVSRAVLSTAPSALDEINSFILKKAGPIYGVNCRKDTREH